MIADEEGAAWEALCALGACLWARQWTSSRRPSEAWAEVGNLSWMLWLLARTAYTHEKRRKVFRLLVLLGYHPEVRGVRYINTKQRAANSEHDITGSPSRLSEWAMLVSGDIAGPRELADLVRAAVPDILAWVNEGAELARPT